MCEDYGQERLLVCSRERSIRVGHRVPPQERRLTARCSGRRLRAAAERVIVSPTTLDHGHDSQRSAD